ncbi:MAG: hypothetical protein IJV69_03990 [Kiritimatiellae bacterium]|nr:hypothetical protein [Kiritimatiellia bacterium]
MKTPSEVADFYPTRRGTEAPGEHVLAASPPDVDWDSVTHLPETGATTGDMKRTISTLIDALKRIFPVALLIAPLILTGASLTGPEGKILDDLPTDAALILDAPAIQDLLATKADGTNVVHTTGDERITGVKTFTDNISIAGKTKVETNVADGVFKFSPENTTAQVALKRVGGDVQIQTQNNGTVKTTWTLPEGKSGTLALASDLDAAIQDGVSRDADQDVLINAKQDKLTIDTALSATSTNPVQNKAVKAALDEKASFTRDESNVFSLRCGGNYIGFLGYESTAGTDTLKLHFNQYNVTLPRTSVTDALKAGKADIPTARAANAVAWQESTSLLTVTPDDAGAVTFDATGWPEGQSLLVRLTLPEDFAGVPDTVRLVGYFDLEAASTYQLTAYVVGGTLHLVPLLKEE